jgi:hypothetical protein
MDLYFADQALQNTAESTLRSNARFGPGDGALLRQRLCELMAADNLAVVATVPSLGVHPLASREASFVLPVGPHLRLVFEVADSAPQDSGNGEIDLAKVATIRILAIEKCDES